jgi:hypothetical protein
VALTRELKAIITADVTRFRRGMAAASASSAGFGGKVRAATPALAMLGKVGLVAGAAVGTTLAVGLVKAGKAAADAEASNARLTAQLKALGQNTDAVRSRVDSTVTSLSLMSGFDDEDIQDTFSGLARSSGDANTALKALPVTLDLARARQMEVGAAGKLVERVLAGNVTGLKRYGIAVEKGMTPTEALGLLQTKVAGQAKAFGETAAGGMERAKVAAENAFERIGVSLTPAMNALGNFAARYLPVIAENIAGALEGVIGWVRANWPQISSTIRTVFEAVRGHIQTVWVPIFTTAISVIRSVVDIVRSVWPTLSTIILPIMRGIQSGVQAALGVVRGIFEALAALFRGDFSGAVRAVGSIMRSIFGGLAGIISGVGTAVTNAALALARGIGNGILKVGQFVASLPGKIVSAVGSAITAAVSKVLEKAKAIGSAIVDGAVAAIKAAPGAIKDALLGLVPGPVRAVVSKIINEVLSEPVRKSIRDARARLQQFGSDLGGLIASRRSSTYVDPITGQTPAAMRAAHDLVLRNRREDDLKAARRAAGTAEEMTAAQQALDDFYTEERITNAERAAEESAASAERSMNDLVAQFNRGTISADQFKTRMQELIGAPLGDELGAAFSEAFRAAIANVTAQVNALNVERFGGDGGERGVGDSGVVDPQDVVDEEAAAAAAARRYPKGADLGPWSDKKARDRALNALEPDTKARSGPTRTGKKGSYMYGIRVKPLADGGILRRAILAGEAGPEAVIPLDGSRGRTVLARAMRDAGGMVSGAPTIVVNVAGNEFSAEEFARKVSPELRRLIALTGSY